VVLTFPLLEVLFAVPLMPPAPPVVAWPVVDTLPPVVVKSVPVVVVKSVPVVVATVLVVLILLPELPVVAELPEAPPVTPVAVVPFVAVARHMHCPKPAPLSAQSCCPSQFPMPTHRRASPGVHSERLELAERVQPEAH
jgi:hypothetical protein